MFTRGTLVTGIEGQQDLLLPVGTAVIIVVVLVVVAFLVGLWCGWLWGRHGTRQ